MTTTVIFELPAENVANASEGFLLGDFNNWNHDEAVKLLKKEDGSMYAEIALTGGKSYQYRYLLNDGRWVNDNKNTTWSEVYGDWVENCVVEVPAAKETASSSIAKLESKTVAPAKKAAAPKKVAAPKKAKEAKQVADDLTKIEGIGKKIGLLLNKAGILTYKDLSKSTIKNLQTILEAAGNAYSVHNPASWPKQSKLAATGKWEHLAKLQGELVAGK